jgi:hypothetical protein
MGILSWLKNRRQREDAEELHRAQEEYFDTPEEQRIESGDIEDRQADYRIGMLGRDAEMFERKDTGADPEERLAEEEER